MIKSLTLTSSSGLDNPLKKCLILRPSFSATCRTLISLTGETDGLPLPEQVTLTGLTVPGPGYWQVPFLIYANGTIQLEVDPNRQVIAAADPHAHFRRPAEVILT